MAELKWDITICPPIEEGAQFKVVTKILGGHIDEKCAETAEQAEQLKEQILERLQHAIKHLQMPWSECDAG